MVKDLKYIIKRIIIGVGIAIILMLIKGNLLIGVHAKTIENTSWGNHQYNVNFNESYLTFSTSNLWQNGGMGYVNFSFSVWSPNSKSPIINQVLVYTTPGSAFTCNFGAVSTDNTATTYSNGTASAGTSHATYSVSCPVNLGANGITNVQLQLLPYGQTSDYFSVTFGTYVTFEKVDDDISSAINNQTQTITNNNNTNTQNIINNQNSNAESINNNITDDSGVADNDISDLFGELEESNTPISDLLTMPITLINAYISGMSGSCQSINLGELYGSYLILPCINVSDYLGSDLWNVIDILISLFLIYNLSQLFITAFDDLTSLKDSFSWQYGVEGRHVARGTRMDRYGD